MISASRGFGTTQNTYDENGNPLRYNNDKQWIFTWKNGSQLIYLYNPAGNPIGMQHRDLRNSAGVYETYWFQKNFRVTLQKYTE